MVFFNPSLNGVDALKSNPAFALEVSNILLGWPSGIIVDLVYLVCLVYLVSLVDLGYLVSLVGLVSLVCLVDLVSLVYLAPVKYSIGFLLSRVSPCKSVESFRIFIISEVRDQHLPWS